jgi:dipeptidyl aminopeptidase/acylaminoacyl peptidase
VFPNSETIALAYVKEGTSHLALVDIASGRFTPLACPLVDIQYDALSADGRGNVLVVGSSVIEGHGLYRMTTSSGQLDPLRRSHLRLGAQQISMPKAMQIPRTLPGTHGVIHGFLHLPYSPEYKGLENTRPPLVVHAHGGPTNHWRAGFSPQVQYLTSRGFAVFLLNYAGSTGYGKQYRELLNGRWGELDAADAAMAAEYLANVEKLVDGNRMSIEGPSAGGYLALATAALFPQTWRVSIVMCGISDVDSFSLTSHKFESQYSEHLVFGEQGDEMSQEERKARGIARSPIHHARNFNSAVLLIHGNTDTVVVPAQAKSMHESLQSVSNEVELILIPDWGHKLPAGDVLRATWAAQERLWMKHLVEPCV